MVSPQCSRFRTTRRRRLSVIPWLAAWGFCALPVAEAVSLRRSVSSSQLLAALPATVSTAENNASLSKEHVVSEIDRLLRSSGEQVGSAVDGMLDITEGLEQVSQDISSEYGNVNGKRRALAQENAELRARAESLKAALEQQRLAKDETVRLQHELKMQLITNKDVTAKHGKEKESAKYLRERTKEQIKTLEGERPLSEHHKTWSVVEAQKQTNAIQQENRELQSQVSKLNEEALLVEDALVKHEVTAHRNDSELLVQIQATQLKIHDLQRQVVANAMRRQELMTLQLREASQTEQVARQRELIVALQANCTGELANIDEEIRTAGQAMQYQSQQLASCQDLDAQNQQLTTQLNVCTRERRALQ